MIDNISDLERQQHSQGEIVPTFHHKPVVEMVNFLATWLPV